MADSEKQFLDTMKGLVSNDKSIREKNLENTREILKSLNYSNNSSNNTIQSSEHAQTYSKIWKSLFYSFWNVDKPVYQKQIAERISKLFIDSSTNDDSNSENLSTFYPLWIKTFLIEFLKKWTQIDFLRMDKYIMLVENVIKFYLEYNLSKRKFENLTNYFVYVENGLNSGFYNYSFTSVILRLFLYTVDDLFMNKKDSEIRKEFLEDYLMITIEKLIKIFIIVKDKREIETFREIFTRIANKAHELEENKDDENLIKLNKNLKDTLMKKFFEVAKSKDDFQDVKRKIFYKLYKKMKYNKDQEDKENNIEDMSVVDPVNNYILNKNYTNKIKKSKLERMRAIIERQKNQKRIEKILKEKEEQKEIEKSNQIQEINNQNLEIKNGKVLSTSTETVDINQDKTSEEKPSNNTSNSTKEEILQENIVKLADEEENEGEEEESIDELEEDEEEFEYEDEEDIYENADLGMEDEEEEDDDFEEYEFDPDAWFLGMDSDEEPTEEDQTLFEAYKNSQKNCEILKPPKEPKKKDFLNKKRNIERNESDNIKEHNNLSDKQVEKNEKIEKINSTSTSTVDKRKNSITSNSSRDGNKKRKRVSFKFSRNEFNEYDQMKPINLTSKTKQQNISKETIQLKGLLKSKNRNRK